MPRNFHFGCSSAYAPMALLCVRAADGDVGGQQRKAERQHQHEVDQQEQPAAVLCREIGEAPEIPDADCASGSREHEAELPEK